MYSYIIGNVSEINSNSIVLECNKVGYMVYVPNPFSYKIGDEYKVSIEDKSGKNVDTTGKVSSIESVVENDIKSNLVKLTLPNKEKLSSGSFAQVYIPNTKREDTLVISKNALFRNGDTPYVYIVTPEDKVKKVNVSLGIENDDYIEVLSGLREGHKVITKGKEFVSIDEKVNIVGGVEK